MTRLKVNVHQRLLHASPERVGALIDALASPADKLWAGGAWPRMRLDRPLGVGARGGHGPIRYDVVEYVPGQLARFAFTQPSGLAGWHAVEVLDATATHCVLEHRVEMRLQGWARITWPLLWRPLHDALIEDGLANAQAALGLQPLRRPWSGYVRMLRAVADRWMRKSARASQRNPHAT
jgi:hypothetical protein